MSNFDEIKKEMEESRNKAESKTKPETLNIEYNSGEISIRFKPSIKKKKKKKAVNYYLSVDLINQIKTRANEFNMKDSVFLEELLQDVLKNM